MTKNPSSIDEAAEWLATLPDPSCTPEQRRAFARWLKRSNVNVKEFLAISMLKRKLEASAEWPEEDIDQLIAEAHSAESNVTPLRPHVDVSTPTDTSAELPAKKEVSAFFRWPLVAAIVFLAVTSLFEANLSIWLASSTYTTGIGELRSIALDDGSIVQLDAQSRIRARFTEQERKIELLQGAAIFHVAKNPGRPFKVSTGFAEIVAVGTAFNVSNRQDRAIVTVMEGRVRVEPQLATLPGPKAEESPNRKPTRLAPMELHPGQQVVIEPRKPLPEPIEVDPIKVTAWTSRRLYFDDTPLAGAVEEFSRYSARRIRVEDPDLAQRRITGTFDATDPASLVAFLERYGDARIDETRDGWVIQREPP